MKDFVRNKTTIVSSRISKEMAKHLTALAQSRNVKMGTYLRVLIREYLSGKSGIRLPFLSAGNLLDLKKGSEITYCARVIKCFRIKR